MNELSGKQETNRPATKRPPVIWHIASVTDERQSVTVVFPVTGDMPEHDKKQKDAGDVQE